MTNFKKALATLVIATTLATATPTPKAEAGIILCPVLVGIVVLYYGIVYNNLGLIILDADGNMNQDSLEKSLSEQYAFIDNRDVISNLASTIREKAINTPIVDGKKTVSLNKNEILNILAPTGLAELNPAAVEQLVQDLK